MKFTSVAMLAIAATPFLSMVSAQTLTELLTAECTAPTPSPTKAKGAKSDTRRQLQAKSGGKGSKSDDSDSSCAGTYLAADITSGSLSALVYDACDVVPPATGTPVAIGGVAGDFSGAAAVQTFFGTLNINTDTLFPFPALISFDGPANTEFSTYIAGLKADVDCDLDFVGTIPTEAVNAGVFIPPLSIASETFPISDTLLVPLGRVTIGTAPARTYLILYFYDCIGDFDTSDISPPVFEYLLAFASGGCTDEEIVGGKKG